jgi:CelD/BcsL family acetyltransferase involved in cellulose biosynthesis
MRAVARLRLRSLELPHHAHMLLADCVCSASNGGRGVLAALVRHLRQQRSLAWDVLYLPHLLQDSCALRALRDERPALVLETPQTRCDYLRCVPFEELAETLSKNFRGSLRKARNKLTRLTGLEYVCATRGPELDAALAEFLDVEASGWKGTAGTGSAIKLDERVSGFYRALAASFGQSGGCEINLLKAEGKCIAGQFCLVTGDTLYILKIGYDEAYAHVAPGNMLLEHTMRRCAEAGVIKYVNLVTDAAWHASWKPESLAVSDVSVFNPTAAGLAAFGLVRGKRLLGAAYRAWYGARRVAAPVGTEAAQADEPDAPPVRKD